MSSLWQPLKSEKVAKTHLVVVMHFQTTDHEHMEKGAKQGIYQNDLNARVFKLSLIYSM